MQHLARGSWSDVILCLKSFRGVHYESIMLQLSLFLALQCTNGVILQVFMVLMIKHRAAHLLELVLASA